MINPISENEIRYLNNYISEIKLVIKGKGNQLFLFEGFPIKPHEVLVNGVIKTLSFSEQTWVNLEGEESNITLRFNRQIETCYGMFYKLKNIKEVDLSNFDASKVIF